MSIHDMSDLELKIYSEIKLERLEVLRQVQGFVAQVECEMLTNDLRILHTVMLSRGLDEASDR